MIRRWLFALCLVSLCLFAAPLTASAFNPFGGVTCPAGHTGTGTNPNQSAVCNGETSQDPISGNNGILLNVADIVAFAAGAAAIILIIVAGIRYITSGGNAEKIASAKNTIIGAMVGIVVIVLARSLILYVVNKL
ncbi:hypothetical protein COY17_04155 [Candidatus Saccharibacteria bacterium CG_4_10_14_0_2_um_filter_52_9]|nr:MAG: hypothetical protein COY17_04155 [Candidatus Saccharibacteria bacterium CG_4_10_14_0_2_um_filter_52_9]